MLIVGIAAAVVIVALIAYWLLVTTEGVFLGQRMVIWMYDLTAHRYDDIKQFDKDDEQYFIVRPLLRKLEGKVQPLILDVATGSGRVPNALIENRSFNGSVIGLDAARKMLQQALYKLNGSANTSANVQLIQQTAGMLPFKDDAFDAVTCLEALEFFPSDRKALKEMVRVLKPGGFLMTTRRRGVPAYFYLNRYRSTENFEAFLQEVHLTEIRTRLWETDYDMVTARKSRDDETEIR